MREQSRPGRGVLWCNRRTHTHTHACTDDGGARGRGRSGGEEGKKFTTVDAHSAANSARGREGSTPGPRAGYRFVYVFFLFTLRGYRGHRCQQRRRRRD